MLHTAAGPMALADDDEDDEPNAKKPRLDDGSLQAEETWARHSGVPTLAHSAFALTACFDGGFSKRLVPPRLA